jgi:hypothetical protein
LAGQGGRGRKSNSADGGIVRGDQLVRHHHWPRLIVLSLAPGVPVSVFVATISFLIYLACWLVGRRRQVPVRA